MVIDKDTLFELYAKRGGLTPQKRAENTVDVIWKIGKEYGFRIDSVYIIDSEYTSDIMYGDKVIISVTEQDGLWQNSSKEDVLDTELHDYYPIYQINAYIKNADKLAQIYSDLHQKIIDKSNEAGIELLSPHYYAQRDGNDNTIPPEYLHNTGHTKPPKE